MFRVVQEVVAEVEKAQRKIRVIESELEKPEDLKEKYKDRSERYKEAGAMLKNIHEDYKLLTIMTKKHHHYYKATQDFSIMLVQDSFKRMLEKRQFKVRFKQFAS